MYLAAIKDVFRMLLPSTQVVGSDQEVKLKYVERMNMDCKNLLYSTVEEKKHFCYFGPQNLNLSAYMSIVALPAPIAAVRRYLCGVKA